MVRLRIVKVFDPIIISSSARLDSSAFIAVDIPTSAIIPNAMISTVSMVRRICPRMDSNDIRRFSIMIWFFIKKIQFGCRN